MLASRAWPDRIMQPQPVSEVKPWVSMSWLRRRTPREIEEEEESPLPVLGVLGMGGNWDLYVIHSFDSKSSRNCGGQAGVTLLSAVEEEDIGEARLTNEEMADPGVGGPSVDVRFSFSFSVVSVVVDVDAVVFDVDVNVGSLSLFVVSAGSPDDCAGHGVSACRYSQPRHQMGCPLSSFFGSGSQKNWMIFLYWLPRSTLFIFSRRCVSILL